MQNLIKNKKLVGIILAALALAVAILILRSKAVETNVFQKSSPLIKKSTPTVLATRDEDGYGLQILAKDFKNVRKVEMLIKYTYKGKENPPLVASGAPQQDSFWAHFRFESCSRGDCLYYKVNQVELNLTLSYQDGENTDYYQTVELDQVSIETLISLNQN